MANIRIGLIANFRSAANSRQSIRNVVEIVMADSPRQFTFLCGRQRAIADGLSRLVEGELQGLDSRPSEGGTSSRSGTQADGYHDAVGIGAGGGQVVVKGGQQHVSAVFQPGYRALADPELAGDAPQDRCLGLLGGWFGQVPELVQGAGGECQDRAGALVDHRHQMTGTLARAALTLRQDLTSGCRAHLAWAAR
jgi:hypothetical protein